MGPPDTTGAPSCPINSANLLLSGFFGQNENSTENSPFLSWSSQEQPVLFPLLKHTKSGCFFRTFPLNSTTLTSYTITATTTTTTTINTSSNEDFFLKQFKLLIWSNLNGVLTNSKSWDLMWINLHCWNCCFVLWTICSNCFAVENPQVTRCWTSRTIRLNMKSILIEY